jgi:uncharacterized protein (TIGR03437 family)
VAAIPLFVGPTQVNAIMPSNAPLGTDTVTVTYQGQSSTGTVQVVASSFGILTYNSSGTGQALSTNDSYALIDYNSVAHPGEISNLWGTGLGAISTSGASLRRWATSPRAIRSCMWAAQSYSPLSWPLVLLRRSGSGDIHASCGPLRPSVP